ncbi:MAG: gyrase subunit, partial [Humisphaera sp.]|nr:gyrase subunit [Humisphaera sp.]
AQGILMRTSVQEIRETGRNAQGDRRSKLDEGDLLVAMAKVDAEETDVPPTGDAPPPAPSGEVPPAAPQDAPETT